MNILVFVTDDGTEAGTGPILFVKNFATSSMPAQPRGLEWKHFATVTEDNALLCEDHGAIKLALEQDKPFVAPRLLRRLKE